MSLDLPPREGEETPDRGLAAWKFLFACFVIEGVLWGFPMAYGVFQEHYSQQSEFANSSNIAVVGTVSTSIYFLGAPLATPFVRRFLCWRYQMVLLGAATCILSLLAASFASSVPVLIATQGVLYGVGFLVIYFPLLSMLNEWFIQRRAFAYAIVYSGGGLSGIGLPFLFDWLLSRYGFRTTLRIFAVAQIILLVPILPLCRGRLQAPPRTLTQRIDRAFVKHPLFWVLAASNLSQSFAYYIPSLYLPAFASSMGLSGPVGALMLAALNLATVLGQLSFGYLVDRPSNIFMLVVVTGVTSSVATFTLWGLTRSLAPLLAFSLVYGLFSGAYVVFWPRFGSMLADDPQPVFSWMAFGKGLGNILTAPIAESLLRDSMGVNYGLGRFGPLVIYLGALMLVSSLGGLGWLASSRGQRRGDTQ
ncbi:MFS general substrate transporter [Aspergillus sclerotiicarbonarius CBS 121057]|uniref:MFS general substrate transporter n=1 Tax=Aspergillus sclerotiicarbonarius (strain CBS 121057 / IBT 28362) TaxID=1448318 RepID=A0A319EH52_ASPSB|nr:MFS general substrate transporter [Aspergillus sclerotiicarbonarius CBS 121057]